MIPIGCFAVGALIGLGVGLALSIALVNGWSFSFAARYGLWRALRSKSMMEFYEKSARNERELYALHFVTAMHEIGGPRAPIPTTRASLDGLYRVAETRMNFDKHKRRFAFLFWL